MDDEVLIALKRSGIARKHFPDGEFRFDVIRSGSTPENGIYLVRAEEILQGRTICSGNFIINVNAHVIKPE